MLQLIGLLMVGWALWSSFRPRNKSPADSLDKTLFTWANTPFKLRYLYQSILILGAAGSGKTSGSGRHFFNTLLSIPNSGGLIIASKPEDRADVIQAFIKHGRLDDLKIFGPDEALRWNFLDALGGDANNIVNGIEVIAEMMNKQKGNSAEPFWARERRRMFYHAVVILQLAKARITGYGIQLFINGAATNPDKLKDAKWLAGMHQDALKRADQATKSKRQQFDHQQAEDYWLIEYPQMADKTRSNIIAEAMGVLHTLNSGVVQDLIGTETNVSCEDMEKGKWLLCDMPLQVHGESGRFVGSTLKYITQRHILARHASGNAGPICIWIDECHNYINSYDAKTLAEQRSHRGVAAYLTQSIPSFYAELGEPFTDALLTNFGTKIFHQLGDAKSASYATSLLGDQLDITTSGAPGEDGNINPSFNEGYHPVLQQAVLLGGSLRTSGGWVDAVVVRPDVFASGERYAIIPFRQE